MARQIHPYNRTGAWHSSHGFYYKCAWRAFHDYKRYVENLQKKEKELHELHRDEDPEILSLLIHDGTRELWELSYQSSVAAHIFGCMAFEGFLNCYGVKRLGEAFYKRHIERIGITEKVALLMLSCEGIVLDRDAPLLKKARTLFDGRNALVHPKAGEIDLYQLAEYVPAHPSKVEIDGRMALLEEIIDDFCVLDRQVFREAEFPRSDVAD